MRRMRRFLRFLLIGFGTVLALGAAAFGYFLYAPAPEAPRLSASVQYDSIRVGDLTRSYAFYAPTGRATNAPLVLALHGSMGNADRMRRATGYGFERLADRHGFVVVYPEGYEGHWNDCRTKGPYAAKRLGIDDVGFLRALVARFRSTHSVDSARVFAVGLSNGAHLSYRLALEAPELVRAVAAVAASLPAPENLDCTPRDGATPVLIMNGTADPINPYLGGRVTIFGFGDRGRVLSSRESAIYFATRNGIVAPPTTEAIARPERSGPTSAERTLWRSGAGPEVRLYTIRNGGHTFPQPHTRFPRILGPAHRALDGPAEIWDFFARQGAREATDPTPPASQSASRERSPVAITRVTVIDVARGRRLTGQTVVIEGHRIATVGSHAAVRIPAGSRVVDGRGRYLIPGLWDMHVHTTGPSSEAMLPVYVAYGVTGVRDMGADLGALRRERTRIATGQAIGPRIVMAGPILDGPLGVPMPPAHRRWRIEVTDAARARRLVDSIAAAGADFIKVHERLAPPVYHAIADQARRRGLAFAGHVPTAVGPAAAAAAGQRSVEHLVNVPPSCTPAEAEALRPRSRLEELFGRCTPDDPAPLLRRFAQAGTWHTPTLVVQQRIALGPDVAPGDPGQRYVPAPVREMLREVGPFDGPPPPPDVRARMRRLLEKRLAQVAALHRAGVGLLVGSDAPGVSPGWSVHEEMRLFTAAGLSPADALRAATLNPARSLTAADSLGTIAPGKLADLVLLDADPLADIRITTRIRAVVANGRYLDRAALDTLLAR